MEAEITFELHQVALDCVLLLMALLQSTY